MGVLRSPLDQVLVSRGVAREAVEDARREMVKSGVNLAEAMRRTEAIPPAVLARTMADLSGYPYLESIEVERVDIALVRHLPLTLARDRKSVV